MTGGTWQPGLVTNTIDSSEYHPHAAGNPIAPGSNGGVAASHQLHGRWIDSQAPWQPSLPCSARQQDDTWRVSCFGIRQGLR